MGSSSTVGFVPTQETPDEDTLRTLCPNHTERHAASECLFATKETRLATFSTFPFLLRLLAPLFAAKGFFYKGSGDIVECYACHLQLNHWPATYFNIDLNHKIFSPKCPLVANLRFPYQVMVNDFLGKPGVLERDAKGNPTMYLQLASPVGKKVVSVENTAPEPLIRCFICLGDEAKILILPCCHLGLCRACSCKFSNFSDPRNVCPLCRGKISGLVHIDRVVSSCMPCGQENDVCTLPCYHNCMCSTCASSRSTCPMCDMQITDGYRMFMNKSTQ